MLGSNFGSLTSAISVAWAGSALASPQLQMITANSAFSFVYTALEGTSTSVRITVDGQQSSSFQYNFNPPVINTIVPLTSSTSGGAIITVSGMSELCC